MNTSLPTKTCIICGRTITWRKKWERDWHNVRYCSKSCRSRGVNDTDRQLETLVLSLLNSQPAGKQFTMNDITSDFRSGLKPATPDDVMHALRRLASDGRLEFLMNGRPTSPSAAKGNCQVRVKQ